MHRVRETLALLMLGWAWLSFATEAHERAAAARERHAFVKSRDTTLEVDPAALANTAMPAEARLSGSEIWFEIELLDHRLHVPLGPVVGQGPLSPQPAEARCGRRACSCQGHPRRCSLVCDICWMLLRGPSE